MLEAHNTEHDLVNVVIVVGGELGGAVCGVSVVSADRIRQRLGIKLQETASWVPLPPPLAPFKFEFPIMGPTHVTLSRNFSLTDLWFIVNI